MEDNYDYMGFRAPILAAALNAPAPVATTDDDDHVLHNMEALPVDMDFALQPDDALQPDAVHQPDVIHQPDVVPDVARQPDADVAHQQLDADVAHQANVDDDMDIVFQEFKPEEERTVNTDVIECADKDWLYKELEKKDPLMSDSFLDFNETLRCLMVNIVSNEIDEPPRKRRPSHSESIKWFVERVMSAARMCLMKEIPSITVPNLESTFIPFREVHITGVDFEAKLLVPTMILNQMGMVQTHDDFYRRSGTVPHVINIKVPENLKTDIEVFVEYVMPLSGRGVPHALTTELPQIDHVKKYDINPLLDFTITTNPCTETVHTIPHMPRLVVEEYLRDIIVRLPLYSNDPMPSPVSCGNGINRIRGIYTYVSYNGDVWVRAKDAKLNVGERLEHEGDNSRSLRSIILEDIEVYKSMIETCDGTSPSYNCLRANSSKLFIRGVSFDICDFIDVMSKDGSPLSLNCDDMFVNRCAEYSSNLFRNVGLAAIESKSYIGQRAAAFDGKCNCRVVTHPLSTMERTQATHPSLHNAKHSDYAAYLAMLELSQDAVPEVVTNIRRPNPDITDLVFLCPSPLCGQVSLNIEETPYVPRLTAILNTVEDVDEAPNTSNLNRCQLDMLANTNNVLFPCSFTVKDTLTLTVEVCRPIAVKGFVLADVFVPLSYRYMSNIDRIVPVLHLTLVEIMADLFRCVYALPTSKNRYCMKRYKRLVTMGFVVDYVSQLIDTPVAKYTDTEKYQWLKKLRILTKCMSEPTFVPNKSYLEYAIHLLKTYKSHRHSICTINFDSGLQRFGCRGGMGWKHPESIFEHRKPDVSNFDRLGRITIVYHGAAYNCDKLIVIPYFGQTFYSASTVEYLVDDSDLSIAKGECSDNDGETFESVMFDVLYKSSECASNMTNLVVDNKEWKRHVHRW